MRVSHQMAHQEATSKLLHTVRMDKKTAFLNPKEEQYWMHFLSRDPLVGDYIRSQLQHNPKLRREVLNQPVCPSCEGFMFFHGEGAQCSACGTFVREGRNHTLKKHVREGHYR